MDIKELIRKYGLVIDEANSNINGGGDTRYRWEGHSGSVVGLNVGGFGEVVFAETIIFEKESWSTSDRVVCYAWERVPVEKYEWKLKSLKRQYRKAMMDMKKYKMEKKLESIAKDF